MKSTMQLFTKHAPQLLTFFFAQFLKPYALYNDDDNLEF